MKEKFSLKKIWESLKKINKKFVIAAVVIIVLIGGFFGIRAVLANSALQATGDMQTEEARMGDLIATVGATGIVRANQSIYLLWQASGIVDEVNVAVGDKVKAGDILATLEKSSLPQNVILAQADLVAAKDALDALYESYEALALAEAEKAVADAKDAVRRAEWKLAGLKGSADPMDVKTAYAKLVLAEDNLRRAKTAFKLVKNKPEDNPKRAAAQIALANAQAAYDAALRDYNYITGNVSEITIAQAEADLALAQQQLEQAEKELEELKAGPTDEKIAAAEARVIAAEAALKSAWIEAPFEGTVTIVEPLPGDKVSAGGQAFRVDDLSRLLVDVEISEVDINRIEVGQDVTLTFDAILAKEYNGVVVGVSPVGTVTAGLVNFEVTVELTDADEEVKPGMTAAVSIVVSKLENVLVVPNRAVRVVDGQRVVYIFKNGRVEKVVIVLGASSDLYSEITGGDLKVGDDIILNPSTNLFEFDGPPGGGGMF